MDFPGTGSQSPACQSLTSGWAISSGESWRSGAATISRQAAGKCGGAQARATSRARALKISQSVLDSQQGGTASPNGWMNEWRSVVFRSSFSYQAGGRQDDVRIKGRRVHPEIGVDNEIELSAWSRLRQFTSWTEPAAASGGDIVRGSAEIVLQEVLVTLGARQQGVAAPDEPNPGPVLRGRRGRGWRT